MRLLTHDVKNIVQKTNVKTRGEKKPSFILVLSLSLHVRKGNQILPSTGFVGVDGGGVAFEDELVLTTTMEVVDPELLLLVVVLLFELILLLVLMLLVVGLTTRGLTGWLDWKKKKKTLWLKNKKKRAEHNYLRQNPFLIIRKVILHRQKMASCTKKHKPQNTH